MFPLHNEKKRKKISEERNTLYRMLLFNLSRQNKKIVRRHAKQGLISSKTIHVTAISNLVFRTVVYVMGNC
jgi:hypothetical protein